MVPINNTPMEPTAGVAARRQQLRTLRIPRQDMLTPDTLPEYLARP